MKSLKLIGTIIVSLFLITLGGSFFIPSQWKVERSIAIDTPPTSIYPWISNYKQGWSRWSSFDYEDPEVIYSYSGPESGKGATRKWESTKMGPGTQIITQADPISGIEFDLFMENSKVQIHGKIALVQSGNVTTVTWTDTGQTGHHPFYKYLSLFIDRYIGLQFEKSLIKLKDIVEDEQREKEDAATTALKNKPKETHPNTETEAQEKPKSHHSKK